MSGGVNVWTSTQTIFECRRGIAHVLGIPEADVRVRGMPVGGAFGGKWPLYEPLVAAAACALNRPLRLCLTRAEDMLATNPVHPGRFHVRLGARSDGTLVALAADILFEAGCYPIAPAGNAGVLLGSMYKVEHLSVSVAEVLTNKPSVGAYRAPGGPQAAFAIESTMDALARELDLDPLELRLRNAVAEGDRMANGAEWPNISMREVLQAVQEHPLWVERAQARAAGRGVGFAIGGWPGATQPGAATCNLDGDGILRVQVGVSDLTGTTTGFAALAADAFGLPTERVRVTVGDTDNAPFSGGTGGSKVMYSIGPAVILAAKDAQRQVFGIASQELEADVDDLEIFESQVRVRGVPDSAIELGGLARKAMEFEGRYAPIIGSGRHVNTNHSPAFCAQLVEVEVDIETGTVRVERLVVFQDVGRAINPLTIEGQIMGGAVQGIGWALYEDLAYGENGQLQAATFMDYAVPNVQQVGRSIETVLVEVPSEHGPLGARGMGEAPVIPTAAAIANAIADATGVRLTALPMTPEKVYTALQERIKERGIESGE